jgi:hypothetical protein
LQTYWYALGTVEISRQGKCIIVVSMKRWAIVKIPSNDIELPPTFERELPVLFKERARAEFICATLNHDKPPEVQAYVVEERNGDA